MVPTGVARYKVLVSLPQPALLIDAAEWYLDEAWQGHLATRHWRRLPARADVAMRRALDLTRQAGLRATFLVPAGIVERAAELLTELLEDGHDVGLSVRGPCPLDQIAPADRRRYRDAWREELAALERVIGRGVHGFGAAWTVAAAAERWWHPVLEELGFAYDATPSRGVDPEVVALDGRRVACVRLFAWELDGEQPSLMGLPDELRAAHAARIAGAADRFVDAGRVADRSVADHLALAVKAPGPPPPPLELEAPARARAGVKRLGIVVPLKDEAEGLPSLFLELEILARALADVADCEFVVVDDGSVDQTWPLLERLARNRRRFRLARHGVNRGVAAAIRTGMLATDAEVVASIDGDLSYDPMELRHMLPMIEAADVVTSSPYHPRGSVQNVPGWRLFLSKTLSRAYRALLGSDVFTWTSCFRVYRRSAVIDLPLSNLGFLGTAELLIRVLRRGGCVVEHPCTLEARLLGSSKMRVARVVLGHLRLLAQVAMRRVK